MTPKHIFSAVKRDDNLEVIVYDTIGETLFGKGVTAKAVKQKLDDAGKVKKITLRINSPGGDIFEGAAIYSLLSQHSAEVECYVDGLAASAAFTVAMAADTIHVSESAMMMCHNAWAACVGFEDDMREMADLLNKVSGTMRDIYSRRSGQSQGRVQQLMDKQTRMTAEEAVSLGFADDVVRLAGSADREARALAASFDLSDFSSKPQSTKRWGRDEVALIREQFEIAAL
jgi:ATP-dependent protease ClpP protease subunit